MSLGQTHTYAHPCTHARVVCVVLCCVALYVIVYAVETHYLHFTILPPPLTHTQSPLYTISLIIESKDKHTVLHTHIHTEILNSRALIVEILFFAFRIIPRRKEGRKEASRQTRTLYLKSKCLKTTIKRLNTKHKTVNKKRWC